MYDEVIRTQRLAVREDGGDPLVRFVAPVTNRGDAIGLLELSLPAAPSAAVMGEIGQAAHALAYIVIANRPYTDVYQWGRRTPPLSLGAEIQHRLLPGSLACEAAQFVVAGALESADHVGGDTFDYVLDRDSIQLSVTDAMGHDVRAALLATLAVGALRRARRSGADLAEQARQADRAVRDHGRGGYVTGQLLRISLLDGSTEFVNAGHPWPLRMRDGEVRQIVPKVDLAFGVSSYFYPSPTYAHRVQPLDLRPGDRLVMLTDGMLERNAKQIDLPELIVSTRGLHPREASRALIETIVEACQGRLRDDATVMCLDWHGIDRTRRDAATGANLTHPRLTTVADAAARARAMTAMFLRAREPRPLTRRPGSLQATSAGSTRDRRRRCLAQPGPRGDAQGVGTATRRGGGRGPVGWVGICRAGPPRSFRTSIREPLTWSCGRHIRPCRQLCVLASSWRMKSLVCILGRWVRRIPVRRQVPSVETVLGARRA